MTETQIPSAKAIEMNKMVAEPEIEFCFFKAIHAGSKLYFCDFHRVSYQDGSVEYKVTLQSNCHEDIIADICPIPGKDWQITQSNIVIPPDIQLQLVGVIQDELEK